MSCKWGEKPDRLRNSSAWACMYKIPYSVVAGVGSQNDYRRMDINECLCIKENCRCYEEEE
jgi:hypothetical protein